MHVKSSATLKETNTFTNKQIFLIQKHALNFVRSNFSEK